MDFIVRFDSSYVAPTTAYTVTAGQTLYAGENPSDFIEYLTTGDSIYAGENP